MNKITNDKKCPDCLGYGKDIDDAHCSTCDGTGRVENTKKNEKLIRKEDFGAVSDFNRGDVFTWKGVKYRVTKKVTDPDGVYVEEVQENKKNTREPYKFRSGDEKVNKGKDSYGSNSKEKPIQKNPARAW